MIRSVKLVHTFVGLLEIQRNGRPCHETSTIAEAFQKSEDIIRPELFGTMDKIYKEGEE